MSWDGSLRLWEPTPGRLLMRLPARWMGVSREGQWDGVVSLPNQQVQLWGITPSQEYHTFLNAYRAEESELREGDVSPDGRLLALGASDGVRLWDVERGRAIAWQRMADTTSALFLNEGRELLTCGPADGLQRWRVKTNAAPEAGLRLELSHPIALPFAPARMARSGNGRMLAVVGESTGKCVIMELASESVRDLEMPHPLVAFAALSRDGNRLATSGWHSHRVKLWDGQSGELLGDLDTRSHQRIFFTPDGREFLIAGEKEFTFHDVKTLEVSRRMPREPGLHPGHVAFSADGKLMAMEVATGLIQLTETTSGRVVARLEDPRGDLATWMSFTRDGTQLIVAARYAGAIHRWDLRAIRARLKPMKLDWDWPEFAPSQRLISSSPTFSLPQLRIADVKPRLVTNRTTAAP
jgi:WD40 repeat protein